MSTGGFEHIRNQIGYNGRPDSIEYNRYFGQRDWLVEFKKYERYNGLLLPQLIKINSGQIKLTHEIMIKSWRFVEPDAPYEQSVE